MRIDLDRTADRLLVFGVGVLLLNSSLGDLLSGGARSAFATVLGVAGVVVAALVVLLVAAATIRNPRGKRKSRAAS